MRFQTELRIMTEQKDNLIDKYINSVVAGDIENLIIKEEWIMLEKLREQRGEYAVELQRISNLNISEIIEARFNLIKEVIEQEVKCEQATKIEAIQEKLQHYDFVIANEEEKQKVENMEV